MVNDRELEIPADEQYLTAEEVRSRLRLKERHFEKCVARG